MARLNAKNNAETVLVQAVSESDTEFIVEDAGALPDVPFRLSIEDEIVEVSAVDGNTLTVERAVEDTQAGSYDVGTAVKSRFTAGMYNALVTKDELPKEPPQVKVDNKTLFINEKGELTTMNPNGYDDSGAPGNKNILAGNMDAGFFGEVTSKELVSGRELADYVGLPSGTSDTIWLKFVLENKILFRSKKAVATGISWKSINDVDCVYGDRTFEIGGLTYKIRLMRGSTIDPHENDEDVHNSEWNRLILPIHERALDGSWEHPEFVESNLDIWHHNLGNGAEGMYSDEDIGGYSAWCQEEFGGYAGYMMSREKEDVGFSSQTNNRSDLSWVPVLELIQ